MSAEPNKRRKLKKRWILLLTAVVVVIAGFLWVADRFREEEKQLRSDLRQAVKKQFPEQAAKVADSFGLSRFDVHPDPTNPMQPGGNTVVLVHGLDEPGSIWMNLAPELHHRGFDVWIMRYPNDQPVVESAELLLDHLKMLPLAGVPHSIVRIGHFKFPHAIDGIAQRLADVGSGRPKLGRKDRAVRHVKIGIPRLWCGRPCSMPSIKE